MKSPGGGWPAGRGGKGATVSQGARGGRRRTGQQEAGPGPPLAQQSRDWQVWAATVTVPGPSSHQASPCDCSIQIPSLQQGLRRGNRPRWPSGPRACASARRGLADPTRPREVAHRGPRRPGPPPPGRGGDAPEGLAAALGRRTVVGLARFITPPSLLSAGSRWVARRRPSRRRRRRPARPPRVATCGLQPTTRAPRRHCRSGIRNQPSGKTGNKIARRPEGKEREPVPTASAQNL